MVGSDTYICSAWPNHNCIPKYRADASIKLYTIQKPAFTHACYRPVTKCLIYLNFMQQAGKLLLHACFIIGWFLFVLFINTRRAIGWVGLQLWVFIQTFCYPADLAVPSLQPETHTQSHTSHLGNHNAILAIDEVTNVVHEL